ncbi:PepSY domain-containing protein [Priestia endophytica]|uniref:PepSY domain-containing protein n=1 Tax=Priestia endophytica TaxID=135735 RepID=UPI00124CAB4E|nr:PepSY domain-containing protein [Priestia endophytica]KAB2488051.1 peptidase M4 [Priestia endophytica]
MYEDYSSYTNPIYRQRISIQQAQQIALQRIPGQILHVDMDMENGILVYEIFILTSQNIVYEVEINGKTGRVLKIEEENDFD